MASWKENGEVPDTDDDADSQSSHIASGDENQIGKSIITEHSQGSSVLSKSTDFESRNGQSLAKEEFEGRNSEVPLSTAGEILCWDAREDFSLSNGRPPTVSNDHLDTYSAQSLDRLPTFRDPQVVFGVENNEISQPLSHSLVQDANNDRERPSDDISITYVQVGSPISSLPSFQKSSERKISANTPQADLPILTDAHSERHQDTLESAKAFVRELSAEHSTEILMFRRRLRHRNPIQLHPYVVEHEKYRRILKARGLTPMRIGGSQGDAERSPVASVRTSTSPTHILSVGTDGSQNTAIDSDSTSQSSLAMLDHGFDEHRDDHDDDFPDVDKLLQSRSPQPSLPKISIDLKTISPKLKQSQKFSVHPILTKELPKRRTTNNAFDEPVSPPVSSSPVQYQSHRIWQFSPFNSSVVPTESGRAWLTEDELDVYERGDLPTPLPSTRKTPPTNISLIRSETGTDDPFAEESESHSNASTSSEESVEIRRFSRKTRGVLPASHLRLDIQPLRNSRRKSSFRGKKSLSPARPSVNSGIAVLKDSKHVSSSRTRSEESAFIVNGYENERDVSDRPGLIEDDDIYEELRTLPGDKSRPWSAEEDDTIDAMLPTRKRKQDNPIDGPSKRVRFGKKSAWSGKQQRQPRILNHLPQPQKPYSLQQRYGPKRIRRSNAEQGKQFAVKEFESTTLSKISILDIVNDKPDSVIRVPHFLRLAARVARLRRDRGKQSPSRKFVKLANRKDTDDAQTLLIEWRRGRIQAPNTQTEHTRSHPARSLREVSQNRRANLTTPLPEAKPRSRTLPITQVRSLSKHAISKSFQTSIDSFVTVHDTISGIPRSNPSYLEESRLTKMPHQNTRPASILLRPAQLELARAEQFRDHAGIAFKSTKRALDALYSCQRRRLLPQITFPLGRFLADSDMGRSSVPPLNAPKSLEGSEMAEKPINHCSTYAWRHRKRRPVRIEVCAAEYRQPSEPLVLERQMLSPPAIHGQHSRLLGLGRFGTSYPLHFGVYPLRVGTFFHKDTLIGSGRLSDAVKVSANATKGMPRSCISFCLGQRTFRWGQWSENVSCELGLCFDWLAERLPSVDHSATDPSPPNFVESLMFVLDFLLYHISFPSTQDRRHFLNRISEILSEFWKCLDHATCAGVEHKHLKPVTEVATMCALISMQALLGFHREEMSLALEADLENILEKFVQLSVKLLLHYGLEKIRNLYDDLLHLPHNGQGLGEEQFAAHAWIVLWTLLNAAKIRRLSFWEVVNSQMNLSDVEASNSARVMEKVWYTMFSILPLCEFDEFGVVREGRRYHHSFDNWPLPQRILKKVLALYKSSQRQDPGFNDYCRAIVGRCHHLIMEWGWRDCRSLVGILFDFFASQNLANLRNEEVYTSPAFLGQLGPHINLALEPEDRCFHIFLKILALAIQNIRHTSSNSIRNLVARVLPNHGRQYLKEEKIREQELISLRNHHDLLCTIYWASPLEHRDILDIVGLLERLVKPDCSHKAACLINVRAWGNLARFAVSLLNTDSSQTAVKAYNRLKQWQTKFFMELFKQYLRAEKDVYAQVDLSRRESISETQLQRVIAVNRRSTLEVLRQCLAEMSRVLDAAQTVTALLQAFNGEILNPVRWSGIDTNLKLGSDYVDVMNKYIDRLEIIKPRSELLAHENGEIDSQDSMFLSSDVDRQTLIHPLYRNVLPNFASLLRSILECQIYRETEPPRMFSIIEVWGRIASLVTEDIICLRELATVGNYAIFDNRKQHKRALKWWPLFLSALVKTKPLSTFVALDLNLEMEWLLGMTQPSCYHDGVFALTEELCRKGHPQFNSLDPLIGQNLAAIVKTSRSSFRNNCLHAPIRAHLSLCLLKSAITYMRETVKSSDTERLSMGRCSKKNNAETLISNMLLQMMTSMRKNLELLVPSSDNHTEYVSFCQQVIALIRSHASDIRPVIDFFICPSTYYWPEKSDPKLYAAGLVSYAIRLSEQPEKTSSELFYYLYNGWKSHTMNASMGNHANFVYEAMKHGGFANFLVLNFLPAALSIGFSVPCSWIITADHLPALARYIPRLLTQQCSDDSDAIFMRLINLVRMMKDGIFQQKHGRKVRLDTTVGCDPFIRSICFQFISFVTPTMRTYAGGRLEKAALLEELLCGFHRLIRLDEPVSHEIPISSYEVIQDTRVAKFADAISNDIEKNWVVQDNTRIFIRGTGATHSGGFVNLEKWTRHIPHLTKLAEGSSPEPSGRFMSILF